MRKRKSVKNNDREEKLREIALKRLEIIKFFEKYGVEATKDAFGVARATVYLWKKKFRESGGKIESLIPKSRAPIRRRQKDWHPEIVEFIKRKRWEYPRMGQDTLKVLLDEFCEGRKIKSLSASTIARIIRYLKDKNEIPNPKAKISFYAKTGKLVIREKKKKKKLRRGNYTPYSPGDLVQMDSISIFLDGIKRYIFCAVDLKTKFGFAYAYKSLTSENAKDFMKKFLKVAPFKVKRVQTDNGSEFAGSFEKFLRSKGIIHFYNYPKDPQSNAYVERFNRTIQEHFVGGTSENLIEPEKFNVNPINL